MLLIELALLSLVWYFLGLWGVLAVLGLYYLVLMFAET